MGFDDVGSSIYNFFGRSNDQRSIDINSESQSNGFSIFRSNEGTQTLSDGAVSTSLTAWHTLEENPLISSVSLTVSDTNNPSLTLQTAKTTNVSINATLCDPNVALNVNYNDESRYNVDLSVLCSPTKRRLDSLNISVAIDNLLDNRLTIGGNVCHSIEEMGSHVEFGAEYRRNDK